MNNFSGATKLFKLKQEKYKINCWTLYLFKVRTLNIGHFVKEACQKNIVDIGLINSWKCWIWNQLVMSIWLLVHILQKASPRHVLRILLSTKTHYLLPTRAQPSTAHHGYNLQDCVGGPSDRRQPPSKIHNTQSTTHNEPDKNEMPITCIRPLGLPACRQGAAR